MLPVAFFISIFVRLYQTLRVAASFYFCSSSITHNSY
jgi:hypothetical protein